MEPDPLEAGREQEEEWEEQEEVLEVVEEQDKMVVWGVRVARGPVQVWEVIVSVRPAGIPFPISRGRPVST